MRKFIIGFMLLFLFPGVSYPVATQMFGRAALTGGTKSVDNIAYADIADGDICIVITSSNIVYFYRFDSSSSTAESSPLIIAPDDVGENNGRWLLSSIRASSLLGGMLTVTDSDGISVTAEQARQGIIVYESGNQQTVALPAVADNMLVCAFATGADGSAEIYLDPDASDHIDHHGTSAAAGEYLHNTTDEKDDYICVIGQGANTWKKIGYYGTWAEQTP